MAVCKLLDKVSVWLICERNRYVSISESVLLKLLDFSFIGLCYLCQTCLFGFVEF